jgi:hypothetical protein
MLNHSTIYLCTFICFALALLETSRALVRHPSIESIYQSLVVQNLDMAYPFLSQAFAGPVSGPSAIDLSNEVDDLLDDDELANQEVGGLHFP